MTEYDFKTKYYPGKLIVLTNEYFNKQKKLSEVLKTIDFYRKTT